MMATAADRMTISLRLSPQLHEKIAENAGGKSVNAAIIQRLEESFEQQPPRSDFHFLDAVKKDVIPRARVAARFGLAVADGTEAVDVVLIDEALAARIAAVTGDERRVHDAAKAAIETAFPTEGVTWSEVAEVLNTLGQKAPASAIALRDRLQQRLASTPAMGGRVAI